MKDDVTDEEEEAADPFGGPPTRLTDDTTVIKPVDSQSIRYVLIVVIGRFQ